MKLYKLLTEQEDKLNKEELKILNFLSTKFDIDTVNPMTVVTFLITHTGLSWDESAILVSMLYKYHNEEVGYENIIDPEREIDYTILDKNYAILEDALNENPKNFELVEDVYMCGFPLYLNREDNTTWLIGTPDNVEECAIEDMRDLIDSEGGISFLSQDFIEDYLYISETDRRLIASDDADNYVENLEGEDDRILEEADMYSDWYNKEEEIDDEIAILNDDLLEFEEDLRDEDDGDRKSDIEDDIETIKGEIELLEEKKESIKNEMLEDAKEKVRDRYYNNAYYELENPMEYYSDRFGYTFGEILENGLVNYNIDEVAKGVVEADGWASILSRYDGNYIEVVFNGETYYVWRED